jgi:hypothetical protein
MESNIFQMLLGALNMEMTHIGKMPSEKAKDDSEIETWDEVESRLLQVQDTSGKATR